MSTSTKPIYCPYCGEAFEIVVDPSESQQNYVEDCYICCRPINLSVTITDHGDIEVVARDENEC